MKDLLSPKEFAEAIGVSQSSIKRWADEGRIEAARTAGGHRRIPIAEAVRFVRETGASVVQPQALGLPGSSRIGRGVARLDTATSELEAHLRAGATSACRGLILSLYFSGLEIAEIADGPIRTCFHRLGSLYEHEGDEGIFIEHRATQICLQAFHTLRSVITEQAEGPMAIGGAAPGDPYQLPTLIASTALSSIGFRAINLGPDTPLSTLEEAARRHGARVLWLSVSSVQEAEKLRTGIDSLMDVLGETGTGLAIGGRAVSEIPLRPRPGLFVGRSMSELVAFARGIVTLPVSSS
ncbi:MAG: excisionase family DNA-binding protein [Acidobacteriota bacterium]